MRPRTTLTGSLTTTGGFRHRHPVLKQSAIYWFRLRHKSKYHRAFAIAALREARENGW